MRSSRMPAVIAALAGVLVAAAACGGGNEASSGSGNQQSSARSAAASPAVPEYKTLGKAELTKVLLPLDAMPNGFSEDADDSTSGDKTFCSYKPPFNPKLRASKSYIKGGGFDSEVVGVGLRQYGSVEQAVASYEAMEKVLQTCKRETSDGEKITYTAMNVPKVGDKSLALRVSSGGATVLQSFSLVGPVLVNVGSGGLMKADADLVADLLGEQVKRYTAASK